MVESRHLDNRRLKWGQSCNMDFLFGFWIWKFLLSLWLRGRLYGDQHQYLTSLWHPNIEEKDIIVSNIKKESKISFVDFFLWYKKQIRDGKNKLVMNQNFW